MKRLSFLMVFMLVVLAACSREATLNTPENIVFDGDETFTWDAVDGATHYIVRIEGEDTVTVNTNQITLDFLRSGFYDLSVRAANQDVMSPYSDSVPFLIDREFEYPTTFTLEETILSWNDTNATSYELDINGTIYTTSTNEFDVSILDENATYTIRVRALYPLGESAYSAEFTYHLYTEYIDEYTARYNVNSTMDMPIHTVVGYELLEAHHGDEVLSMTHFESSENTIYISNALLIDLGEGDHVLKLTTSEGLVTVNLLIADNLKPYIVGNSTITHSEDQDLIVVLETFGKGIESISTNDGISNDDYSYSGHELIIDADYINPLFDENPERTLIFFVLALPYEDTDTIITTFAIRR